MTSSDPKDLNLKFRLKRYLEALGYICELEVQLTSKDYANTYKKEQLSDFDVLAISVEGDFSLRRIAAECKSGKEKALEELLKLRGVLDFMEIDRGYFVKTQIHPNARIAARALNIVCLEEDELTTLLANWQIGWSELEKIERAKYKRKNLNEVEVRKIGEKSNKFVDYLSYDYWIMENQRNLSNLIYLLTMTKEEFSADFVAQKYFLFRVLHFYCLSVLKMCGHIHNTRLSDPKRSLQLELSGGARSRRDREMLIDKMRQINPEITEGALSVDPPWFEDFTEIIARFLKSAKFASQVHRCTYDILENCFFDSKVVFGEEFLRRHDLITIKLVKDVAEFMCKSSGTNKSFFKELLEV